VINRAAGAINSSAGDEQEQTGPRKVPKQISAGELKEFGGDDQCNPTSDQGILS
jgi:hypothetical protein